MQHPGRAAGVRRFTAQTASSRIGVASSRLGYSADTLRRWHDEGHMPAVIDPRRPLVDL